MFLLMLILGYFNQFPFILLLPLCKSMPGGLIGNGMIFWALLARSSFITFLVLSHSLFLLLHFACFFITRTLMFYSHTTILFFLSAEFWFHKCFLVMYACLIVKSSQRLRASITGSSNYIFHMVSIEFY